MNEIVIQSVTPVIEAPARVNERDQHDRIGKSLLDRIVSRLAGSVKSYRIPASPNRDHQSFIERNLLDHDIGPEIHRALR